jgi:hypothetical protein
MVSPQAFILLWSTTMSDHEAIWTFLTDLKHRREVERRLFDLARSNPNAVIAFIEALPEHWQARQDPETDLMKRLYAIALQATAEGQPSKS